MMISLRSFRNRIRFLGVVLLLVGMILSYQNCGNPTSFIGTSLLDDRGDFSSSDPSCPAEAPSSVFEIRGPTNLLLGQNSGFAQGLYVVSPQFMESTTEGNTICFSVDTVNWTVSQQNGNTVQAFTATGNPSQFTFQNAGLYDISALLTLRHHKTNRTEIRTISNFRVHVVPEGTEVNPCPNPDFKILGPQIVRRGSLASFALSSHCIPRPIESVTWSLRNAQGATTNLGMTQQPAMSFSHDFISFALGTYSLTAYIKYTGQAPRVQTPSVTLKIEPEEPNCLAVQPHVNLKSEPHPQPAPGRRMVVAELLPPGCVSASGLDTVWVVNGVKVLDTPKVFTDRLKLEGQGLQHVQLFVYEHRGGEIPACVFLTVNPCKPWVPEIVFHAELTVDLGAVAPPAIYQWISSHCTGNCITNPWWQVSPRGYICVNTSLPHSPPENPYNASKCGAEPPNPIGTEPECPTVCSPWGNFQNM